MANSKPICFLLAKQQITNQQQQQVKRCHIKKFAKIEKQLTVLPLCGFHNVLRMLPIICMCVFVCVRVRACLGFGKTKLQADVILTANTVIYLHDKYYGIFIVAAKRTAQRGRVRGLSI